jgi:hypothetical protein
MGYSVAAVAAAVGLSKAAVLRAIQAGLISGSKNEINEWRIDPAELHHLTELCRLYGHAGEVSALAGSASKNALLTEVRAVAGRAEAVRSRAWLDHTQIKRLSALAMYDQKAQEAARTHWWRLMTALRPLDSPHMTTVLRRSEPRPDTGAADREDLRSTSIELELERVVRNAGDPDCTFGVPARSEAAKGTVLLRKELEKFRRFLLRELFSDHHIGAALGGILVKLVALGNGLMKGARSTLSLVVTGSGFFMSSANSGKAGRGR